MVRVLSVCVYIIGYCVFLITFTQGIGHHEYDKRIGERVTEWFKNNFTSSLKDFIKTIEVRGPCRTIDFMYREGVDGCQFPNKLCLGICRSYTRPLPSGKHVSLLTRCKPTSKNITVPVFCPREDKKWAVKLVTQSCSCESIDYKYGK